MGVKELKPCPCCGGEGKIRKIEAKKYTFYFGYCTECDRRTCVYSHESVARAQWNRRANNGGKQD